MSAEPFGFMCPECHHGSPAPFRCGGPHSAPGSKRQYYTFVDAVPVYAAVSPSLHTHAEQESAASCAPDGKATPHV